MTIIARGVRTDAVHGWRWGVGAALSTAIAHPRLWLLGALGFAVRGGFLALALPLMTIPTEARLSSIFTGDISTTGPTEAALVKSVILAVVVTVLGILAVIVAAATDLAAFETLVTDPDTEEIRGSTEPLAIDRRVRLGLVGTLAWIQAMALLPAMVVAVPLAIRIRSVVEQEFTHPSSFESSFYLRVIDGAREPLLALAVALLVGDLLAALAGRSVLVARFGLDAYPFGSRRTGAIALRGAFRLIRRPFRTWATEFIAWGVTIVVLAPVLWAAIVAWTGERTALLAGGGLGDPSVTPTILVGTVILGAIWVAATVLAGFASSVRAALWSVDALR